MAETIDRLIGGLGFAIAVLIYLYYTAWVIVGPFVDPRVEWFHSLFPRRWWAIALPTALLVLAVSIVGAFVGCVLLRKERKKKKS